MNIFLLFLHILYHISLLRIVEGLVPPVVMGLVAVLYFGLAKARLVGLN